MSEPTKVTRMTKVMDSGSTSRPKFTVKSPAGIQVNRVSPKRRASSGAPHIWAAMAAPMTKVDQDARVASRWPHFSEVRPSSRSRPALASGIRMRSHA